MTGRIRDLGRIYESGSQKRQRKEERDTKSKEVESKCKKISQFFPNLNEQLADPTSIQFLNYDSQAVEAMNLENAAEQIFDTALQTELENKGVNDVNESMQTFTNVTENNTNDLTLWENKDDVFRLYILENGLNQKTNISFINSKRTFDDGINRYLKKEHFYRVLTNVKTIKRNWMLHSETTGMAYCSVCKLFAVRETHFTSEFNDWKHTNRLHEHENSESHRNASLAAASFKTKNARVNHSLLVQIDKEKVYWRAMLKRVVTVVKFLCERGLPLRGVNEVFGSPQNGNFLGLLELLAQLGNFLADHI